MGYFQDKHEIVIYRNLWIALSIEEMEKMNLIKSLYVEEDRPWLLCGGFNEIVSNEKNGEESLDWSTSLSNSRP